MLKWIEDFDCDGNSFWTAKSAYQDEGDPICFRLCQQLVNNQVEWYEDHDAELMGFEHKETWTCLEEAKVAVEQSNEVLAAVAIDDPVSFALYRAEELHEKQEERKRHFEELRVSLREEMDKEVARLHRIIKGH